MKLWEGDLHESPTPEAESFNRSIAFDKKLWQEDITGSLAHAAMLGKTGILTGEEEMLITDGLLSIFKDLSTGRFAIEETWEDIHTAIEAELTKRIGDVGKKLHTARSRNDQVATDLRLYALKKNKELQESLQTLCKVFLNKAKEHTHTMMPGYTHLQAAQPVTFAQHLLAYVAMFLRDMDRLETAYTRADASPLGSGALAGTTFPIDRAYTAEKLGFSAVMANSMDGVSDRDFVLDLIYSASLIMMHLSRICEEIIFWSSQPFSFVTVDDGYSTGSSIMPQKKNPDMAELIRGKTGRVYGSLMQMFTVMKGIPLAYNKDLQEDKEFFFDSMDTLHSALIIMQGMMETLRVNVDNMRNACAMGYLNATDCADYLTKKGMSFRDAYRITGNIVHYARKKNRALEKLSLDEFQSFSKLFDNEIYAAIDLERILADRTSQGGTSPSSVQKQIEELEKRL